ncbi:MAG: hypothetical protein DMG38_27920 [Acidobacteria bacterium]|nr:MAG: hypothetical protein DMG38_27920 [Acidobacteriota bacterium]
MRTALFCFAFVAVFSGRAAADRCAGATSRLALVFAQLAQGDIASARENLGPIQAQHPDCPEIILALARMADETGNAPDAGSLFARYLQLAPQDPRAYTYFGRFLIERRQYDQADSLSAQALETNPQDPGVMALRGQILDMKGQPQEGLALLERASELDGKDAETEFYLGTMYDRAKRPAEAVRCFKRTVAINPHNARAYDYLALNLEPLGQVVAAEQAYGKALEVNRPGPHFDAFLDYNYGRFLGKRGDPKASKFFFDRAVELAPDVRAVWYERAKLNLQLKNYEQARSDAERAATLRDDRGIIIDLQIYALLERVYHRLGDAELAQKYAELAKKTPVLARGERQGGSRTHE